MNTGAASELFLRESQLLALAPHCIGEALSEVAHAADDCGLTAMGLQSMSDKCPIEGEESPEVRCSSRLEDGAIRRRVVLVRPLSLEYSGAAGDRVGGRRCRLPLQNLGHRSSISVAVKARFGPRDQARRRQRQLGLEPSPGIALAGVSASGAATSVFGGVAAAPAGETGQDLPGPHNRLCREVGSIAVRTNAPTSSPSVRCGIVEPGVRRRQWRRLRSEIHRPSGSASGPMVTIVTASAWSRSTAVGAQAR